MGFVDGILLSAVFWERSSRDTKFPCTFGRDFEILCTSLQENTSYMGSSRNLAGTIWGIRRDLI